MSVIGALLIALIVLQPVLGVRRWRRFLQRSHEPGARVRQYRNVLLLAWGWSALIAAGMLLDGWPARAVGLLPPRFDGVPLVSTLALSAGLAIGLVLPLVFRRTLVRHIGTLAELLPRTPVERVWFVAVALTAGFCEELLHRGFLLAFVSVHWPHPPLAVVFVLGSVPFGLGHAYQGRRNVVVTGLFGAIATALYLAYRSLWIPVAVHALIDLRAALLMPSPEAPASDRAAA